MRRAWGSPPGARSKRAVRTAAAAPVARASTRKHARARAQASTHASTECCRGARSGAVGSVYEQPALTETADAFVRVLGPGCVHWLPTGILARPNTGQLGLYRARVASGHPAAPLVHINPLKDWDVVEELVVRPGCGAFERFRPALPPKGSVARKRLQRLARAAADARMARHKRKKQLVNRSRAEQWRVSSGDALSSLHTQSTHDQGSSWRLFG